MAVMRNDLKSVNPKSVLGSLSPATESIRGAYLTGHLDMDSLSITLADTWVSPRTNVDGDVEPAERFPCIRPFRVSE